MTLSDSNSPKEATPSTRPTFAAWICSDKARKLIVLAGLLGMVLLLLSVLFDNSSAAPLDADVSSEDYATEMETKLHDLLLCVDGVTDCRVLITLENGNRVVYANGGKEPLTECEPTVRGVVVVVNGAVDETVENEVKHVVKTALHLAEKRVCVVANTTN